MCTTPPAPDTGDREQQATSPLLASLYVVAGGIPLVISLPLAVKYRYWQSILWMPT